MADKRVLVVDEDPSTRFLFRLIFESASYRVTEAPNGVAALILIHDELPDLVVTDMMMPMMKGTELIRHLRAEPRTAGIRMLAVTANPNARAAASLADGALGNPSTAPPCSPSRNL